MIPQEAMDAAKEAMREVTPPPRVSKSDWLAEHGGFALIAGAIAAAAPFLRAQALEDLIAKTEARGRADVENGQYITAQRRRSGLWLLRDELARAATERGQG